jgi:hypothetical protein
MLGINSKRIYILNEAYESIKERADKILGKYRECPDLVKFNNMDRCVTFSTEKLIPTVFTNRPRVMLLFSNPHPYSVHQGMFLSPNTKGRENPFWSTMNCAGWLNIPKENRNPAQLADICLNAKYQGPFELIFYCYYAFPTVLPEDIRRIFGKEYFRYFIEPESMVEFRQTIRETSVKAVVTFNKGIFNLVAKEPIEKCIDRLLKGELIQSQIKDTDIPVFLTFPTGWHFHKQYKQFRKTSLDAIRSSICGKLNIPESKKT